MSVNFNRSRKLLRLSVSTLLLGGLSIAPLMPAAMAQSTSQSTSQSTQVAQSQPQQKMRIAVLDFDYSSTGQNWVWWGGGAPSRGVSDMLTNKLVEGGSYSVIERSRIDDIIAEQNLGDSGRISANTAAQIGRILGVDAVVIGSVTRYNLTEGSNGVNVLGFGAGGRRDRAEVQLTVRLVNTTTAEIIATAEATGKSARGSGGVSTPWGGVASNNNNGDQLLSNAAEDAVTQLATNLNGASSRLAALPPSLPTVQALVADILGTEVVLNKGTTDGFRPGMTISIERVTREVKDPATGAVLRVMTSPVGRVELTEVDAGSAVGRVVSGAGFRVGDRAIAVQ
jgi:curli biogenesis system outer membrane secretion channel CsgG